MNKRNYLFGDDQLWAGLVSGEIADIQGVTVLDFEINPFQDLILLETAFPIGVYMLKVIENETGLVLNTRIIKID